MYRLVLATQPCTLASTTGYRVYRLTVLATQPCTLASTTGTECTGWYWLHSLVHLLQQIGYRVYRLVLATQPCTLASATTGYRVYRQVPSTQPCTLASTTEYSVPAGSGYTALYTGFNNWLQSVRLVLATQSCTLASTYRLQSLLTGCWLHSPYCTVLHPNWLQKKKKKAG